MKLSHLLVTLTITLALFACSPHSGAGVWKATGDNDFGINKLVIAFDGWAEFETTRQDNATWHCFWARSSKQKTDMECSSSINPEQKEKFILTVNNEGVAELQHKSQLIGSFTRLDESPTFKK